MIRAAVPVLQEPILLADPTRQKLVAVALAIAILLVVLELVRRRKLREEYSVVWVVTGLVLLVLALNRTVLIWLTGLVGAAVPNSMLFFCGLLFLMLLCLQFSIRLSRLTYRTRKLTRHLALLEEEVRELQKQSRHDRE